MNTDDTPRKGNRNREIVTSLRLNKEEHDKLKRLAATERRSLANQLRHLLDQADDVGERKAA